MTVENLEARELLAADPGWLLELEPQSNGSLSAPVDLVVDQSGNTYTSGYFIGSVDFDPGPGSMILNASGDDDAFVAKYSPSGSLVWVHQISADVARAWDIALDSSGGVYTVGHFSGNGDFDGDGVFEVSHDPERAPFITKLAQDTGATVWARTLGEGSSYGEAHSVAVDSAGAVYTTGLIRDPDGVVDLDPGPGTAPLQLDEGRGGTPNSIYVLKLDTDGNYLTSWGGFSGETAARAFVEVDDSGVYLAGTFWGEVDFNPGPGEAIRRPHGSSNLDHDMFLAKYSDTGQFDWVRTLRGIRPGNYVDFARAITLDNTHVYFAGDFYDGLDLDDDGSTDLVAPGEESDAVVASYQKSDGTLTWIQAVGGEGSGPNGEVPYDLALDGAGGLWVVGRFFKTPVDFDPSPTSEDVLTNSGRGDGFLWKLDTSGQHVSARRMGGTGQDSAGAIATGTEPGIMHMTVVFQDTADFPNGSVLTGSGLFNGALMKFNTTSPLVKIASPANAQIVTEDSAHTFSGTATDGEDGDLTSGLAWQSHLDGPLGSGGTTGPVTLNVGVHVVTAQVTDSDGLTGSDGLSIVVNPLAPTNLTASTSGNDVNLNWGDQSSQETAYVIERAAKPKGKSGRPQWSVLATLAANTTSHTDPAGKGSWLYRVKATAAGVASDFSNEVTVSIKGGGGGGKGKGGGGSAAESQSSPTTASSTSDSSTSDAAIYEANTQSNHTPQSTTAYDDTRYTSRQTSSQRSVDGYLASEPVEIGSNRAVPEDLLDILAIGRL